MRLGYTLQLIRFYSWVEELLLHWDHPRDLVFAILYNIGHNIWHNKTKSVKISKDYRGTDLRLPRYRQTDRKRRLTISSTVTVPTSWHLLEP